MIISNEKVKDIMEIVNSLEESVLLVKGISKTTKNKIKYQKGGFPPILFGTFAASVCV